MEQEGTKPQQSLCYFSNFFILFLIVFAFLLFGDKVGGMNSYGAGGARNPSRVYASLQFYCNPYCALAELEISSS